MALYTNGDFANNSSVRVAFDDLSDEQVLDPDPTTIAHSFPPCAVNLPRGIFLNTPTIPIVPRSGEATDYVSHIENEPSAITAEIHHPGTDTEDEVFVVESPKVKSNKTQNLGVRAAYKGEGLSVESLNELAEDAAWRLARRDYGFGFPNSSGLFEPNQRKDSCEATLQSVLARHPRAVGAVTDSVIPLSAVPTVYMPKLISADVWYSAYCPERKHHLRPQPPIPFPRAEDFDLTLATMNASPVASFSSTNGPQAMFTTQLPESRLLQPSIGSKASMNITVRSAAKRAKRRARRGSFLDLVTTGNNFDLSNATTDTKAFRVTQEDEKNAVGANERDALGDSDEVLTATQVDSSQRRHSGQHKVTSQATESRKPAMLDPSAHTNLSLPQATVDPVTARAERASQRAADKDSKSVHVQPSVLPPRPIISLKRKRRREFIDDDYSDLPFRTLHNLLKTIQKNIEDTIFFFIQKWHPDCLRQRGWEVPEQGELTKSSWWRALEKMQVPIEAVDFDGVNFEDLYTRTAQIRHAAVHRLDVSNLRLRNQMIPDAIRLVHGFKDTARENELRKIQRIFTSGENLRPDLLALQHFLGMGLEPAKPSMSRRLQVERPTKRARIEEPAYKHVEVKEPAREYIIIEDDDPVREFIDLTQDTDEGSEDYDADEDYQNSDEDGCNNNKDSREDRLDNL